MNKMTFKLFYIFLVFTIGLFNFKATESFCCFFPFSKCTFEQKRTVINHYNIGTILDRTITQIPSCDTRNVLYTNQLENNIVVVSGLYPVAIPEIINDTKAKQSIKIKGLCLPQILLTKDEFLKLLEYVNTMNDYESIKKTVLSTITTTPSVLDAHAIEIANKYHICLAKLSSGFLDYQKIFITYMDRLKEYVNFINKIRKIDDSEAIQLIDNCKTKILSLTIGDIVQIKKYFDEILVNGIKQYAHSETAFLYYCHITGASIPSILFTTRDMCPVCEDTIVKKINSIDKSIIVVSTKEYENSWTRHDPFSKVKKVVIDTDVRFDAQFSSLTDETKVLELKAEYEKLLSPRGISLLFQQMEIPSQFSESFSVSEDYFDMAIGNKMKKVRRNLTAAYALDSKLITLNMLIRMYQCVFAQNYLGMKTDIISETSKLIESSLFSHINQQLLQTYMKYMSAQLKPDF
ncbi:MAG: hypothetical protein IJ730_05710 [Alphaproteobacteria bacterium]|nr:hypothetical protein [Alphaproteobacteria bacterium]